MVSNLLMIFYKGFDIRIIYFLIKVKDLISTYSFHNLRIYVYHEMFSLLLRINNSNRLKLSFNIGFDIIFAHFKMPFNSFLLKTLSFENNFRLFCQINKIIFLVIFSTSIINFIRKFFLKKNPLAMILWFFMLK